MMASLQLFENGNLPTRSAVVPATPMMALRDDEKARLQYYKQFVATWYLTYERISVPANQRFDMKETTANSELIPYANRLIEKFSAMGRDILWEAWSLGAENYVQDNGQSAFPVFNFGVLVYWISKYRHEATKRLHPEMVADKPLPETSAPKMEELLKAIRSMPADQLELMLELQSAAYQPLFLHLAKKMEAEDPKRYEGLRIEAKRLWCVKVGARLGVDPDRLAERETKDIVAQWEARFKKDGVLAIEDAMPNIYTDWRRLLLVTAEMYV